MARTLGELVEDITKREGWKQKTLSKGFQLTLPQPGGRSQVVQLYSFEHEGEQLVRITSTVGEKADLTQGRYEKALEVNYHLPYGHLAIDGEELVITETRPLKTTTPETSGQAIKYIARQADLYEKLIFRKDIH